MKRPEDAEVAPHARGYVALVPEGNLVELMREQGERTAGLLETMGEKRSGEFRYAPGKWTAKEVLGHLTDTERIFSYRSLRLARGDETPLPGFEQGDYVLTGRANERALEDLLREWRAVRGATLHLFGSFSEEAGERLGRVSDWVLSVRGIAYTAAGHERHHYEILRAKYAV